MTRLAASLILVVTFPGLLIADDSLSWSIKLLTVDGNEGCDVADVNNDGKLDVIAGRNWYAAPDYVPRPVRTIEDWNGYVESNGDFAYDVDGDGWVDVIAGSFLPTKVHWYKNPGAEGLRLGKTWEQHELADTGASQNEAELLFDLDGDKTPEWIVNSWKKDTPMNIWRLHSGKDQEPGLEKIQLGASGNGHGMGIGDISGDGKADLIVGQGWYERPESGKLEDDWKFHPDWDIHASIPILVRDMDDDGRNDMIVGKGHDFGLFWWRQTEPSADGKLQWEQHLIDDTFSQPHTMLFADLDGDGDDELITGKRYHAHNGRDPGGQQPPCLYYFTWDKSAKKFTRHTIDRGSVGSGLQIRTADLNSDGNRDLVVAGKSGTYILFNLGLEK